MFDLAWSEIALIGVVALLVIGPKDLPGAIRGVAGMLGKARRMAGEFQGHVDEMVREAKLDDVKREIDSFRSNVQNEVYKAAAVDDFKRDVVDPLKDSFNGITEPLKDTVNTLNDPLGSTSTTTATPAAATPAPEPPAAALAEAAPPAAEPPSPPPPPAPPAFVPPAFLPPGTSRG
jgi:sec-independent protein translocase protein TatB